MSNVSILNRLYDIIQDRKNNPPEKSYVVHLFEGGVDKIISKITEEAGELVESAVEDDPGHVVYEAADLFFHVMVLLGYKDIHPELVINELERRFGTGGFFLKDKDSNNK